ncbi:MULTISPECIES: pirin family protein [unclassified Streptomyces]|uniref:pirin family protein n=1 Tax=unclassified Streptomyces TaxID=2593676 RepID=UPI002DD90A9C|nr:pirin family protein [Streptomyces sp. NBC_01795]WSA97200.1 pirin family protein [Streptomyces sp. NBC_01795]WSS46360.1 pirin family protein [Streptomyces sp. NBC_01187]
MPAITVENPLALPRVPAPPRESAAPRPVLAVSTAPSGFEGEGFPVRRAFAGIDHRHLDPFIMMDQMGEVEYAPGEPKGTPWHPHRGFETVTYLLDGSFVHQDSEGGGGVLSDGDTQWMTAGSGLLHIEAPPEELVISGGLFHGLQLWVNLPAADKMKAPRYQDIGGGNVKLLTTSDGGALLRLIAGSVDGHEGPGATHTPITMIHATVSPGAELTLPWREDFNGLAYVLAGRGSAGTDRRPVHTGQTVVFGRGGTSRSSGAESGGGSLTLRADASQDSHTPDLEVVLLGGRPIREPMAHYGPFVMNSHVELAQAFEDFKAGRLGRVPATPRTPQG